MVSWRRLTSMCSTGPRVYGSLHVGVRMGPREATRLNARHCVRGKCCNHCRCVASSVDIWSMRRSTCLNDWCEVQEGMEIGHGVGSTAYMLRERRENGVAWRASRLRGARDLCQARDPSRDAHRWGSTATWAAGYAQHWSGEGRKAMRCATGRVRRPRLRAHRLTGGSDTARSLSSWGSPIPAGDDALRLHWPCTGALHCSTTARRDDKRSSRLHLGKSRP